MIGLPLVLDTAGMTWRTENVMKYKLDNLVICSNRFIGKNDQAVYLDVRIELGANTSLVSGLCLSIGNFLIGFWLGISLQSKNGSFNSECTLGIIY